MADAERTLPAQKIRGTGLGEEFGRGKLRFFDPESPADSAPAFRGTDAELAALEHALAVAREDLARLAKGTAGDIFAIHQMLLEDPDFADGARELIGQGIAAAQAAERSAERMARVFEGMEDELFRARAADLRDVGTRVARLLRGREAALPKEGGPFLLVCRELSPGDTALLDPHRVAGVICAEGSPTSHASILARALGLPVLLRAGQLPRALEGKEALLDAAAGELTVSPGAEEAAEFAKKEQAAARRREQLESVRFRRAVTPDGKEIRVFANIGTPEEAETAFDAGADGIGLFRSEFLFLGRSEPPDEEEQYAAYARVLEAAAGREVVIRTLDIGADKTVPYLPGGSAENPALGVRGIRLCLCRPDLFRTQLRALCRASAHGALSVMLPMITNADEIVRTRQLWQEAAAEIGAGEKVPLGIMLETPAAAVMAEELAREADFFSVGTNDLCQYVFAADRQEAALGPLWEGEARLEPVFRLIRYAADRIHGHPGKWIGVCGELAADTALTARLIACGADELSVIPAAAAAVKAEILGQEETK